jgi:Cof subfamily protein (haloacid dehalogenase superfamily)
MDFIFFDLDGTLLNSHSRLSDYTKETLQLLDANEIAYTVATGRSLTSARQILNHHPLAFTQIYNNGATLWHPLEDELVFNHTLLPSEIEAILLLADTYQLTPFVSAVETALPKPTHFIFHSQPKYPIEQQWLDYCDTKHDVTLRPLATLGADIIVTNISMIGQANKVQALFDQVNAIDELIAYSGPTRETEDNQWIDIHHQLANKGSAIEQVKAQYDSPNIICFGDNSNDVTMFDMADECYAPANAIDEIKGRATKVIGHHNEDGVARFLRQRFSLSSK